MLAVGFACATAIDLGASPAQSFSIEAGPAKQTLKLFAQQSRASIVFEARYVNGVTTNRVVGEMSPSDALQLLLHGTPLVFNQDATTSAYAISKIEPTGRNDGSAAPVTSSGDGVSDPQTTYTDKMNSPKKPFSSFLRGLTAAGTAMGAVFASGQETATDDEDVVELSPFTVEANGDSYLATSTLAGTRLKTDVADLGSSITIVTGQMMDDLAATDASSILTYTANTEVGGVLGTFSASNGGNVNNGFDDNAARIAPENAQRIRGLVSAELTRNFYRTSIPMDAYNTSAVTINRGPNSVLFGLGSPGGIIENTVNSAMLGQDFNEFSLRISHFGGHRETLDINQSLLNDRLAIRLNLLNSEEQYEQAEAFRDDRRIFVAVNALLREGGDGFLGSTRLRGNFESGDIESNPPIVVPPTVKWGEWWSNAEVLELVGNHPAVQTEADLHEFHRTVDDDGDGRFYQPQYLMPNTRSYDANGNLTEDLNFGTFVTVPVFVRSMQVFPSNSATGGPEFLGLQGYSGTANWPGPRGTMHMRASNNGATRYGGINSPTLMDRNTFDYQKHLFTGDTNRVTNDFDVYEVALEQLMLDGNMGIEVGLNQQDFERFSFTPWASGGNRRLFIEAGKFTPVPQSLPHTPGEARVALQDNPNLGRPMMVNGNYDEVYGEVSTETMRATAFFKHDFKDSLGKWGKWLGSHSFTGLLEEYEETTPSNILRLKVTSDEVDAFSSAVLRGDFRSGNTNAVSQVFLGPSAVGTSGPGDLALDLPINIPTPAVNQPYQTYYWDNVAKQATSANFYHTWANIDQNINRRKVSSDAFVAQSRWLSDHLVTLFAWRTDTVESFEMLDSGRDRNSDGSYDLSKRVLGDQAASKISGDTFTQSYVLKFPEAFFELPFGMDLRAHYFESETFEPASVARNIYGEVLPNPNGTTEEYGFSVDFLERRLSLRVNWYETSSANARGNANGAVNDVNFWQGENGNNGFLARIAQAEADGFAIDDPTWPSVTDADPGDFAPPSEFGFNSYDEIYAAHINAIPEETRNLWNYKIDRQTGFVEATPIEGLTSTFDFVSEGTEIELVGALTDSWNVSLNVAQQTTVQANTATRLKEWVDEVYANYQASNLNFGVSPSANQGRSAVSFMSTTSVFNVDSAVAQNGVQSQEQREWRANLINSYSFKEGGLKGVTVGAAVRWQDKAAIGNPLLLRSDGSLVSDVNNPYYGSDELNADVWVGYKKRLSDSLDWKIQLNVRNLIGADDEIPIAKDALGRLTTIRIPVERQVLVTNTFSF